MHTALHPANHNGQVQKSLLSTKPTHSKLLMIFFVELVSLAGANQVSNKSVQVESLHIEEVWLSRKKLR